MLANFSIERIVHDYGLDLVLFTYNPSGELQDGGIYLQVKATEQATIRSDGQSVVFRVARADVLTWLRHRLPVILTLYDVSAESAYWVYVQRYFGHLPGFDLQTAAQTITMYLPLVQTLTPIAVEQFANFRDNILAQLGTPKHA